MLGLVTKRDLKSKLVEVNAYIAEVDATRFSEIELLSDKLSELTSAISSLTEQLSAQQKIIETLQGKLEEYEDDNNISLEDRPRFRITNYSNKDGKAQINVEYNNKFIASLKDLGYSGIDDDDLVSGWLNDMFEKQ